MTSAIIAFISAFTVDFLWTRYIAAVGARRILGAALLSSGVGLCTLLGLSSALGNPIASGAYLVGLFCGTWVAIRLDH